MTDSPRFARAILLAAIAFAPLCAAPGHAADRGGHDYVVDSLRASPRTRVLGDCVRTGMPEAGAPAEDCDGSTRSATPAPAVTTDAPPSSAAAAVPEAAPPESAVAAEEPVGAEPVPLAEDEGDSSEPAEEGMQADTEPAPAQPAAQVPAPSLARVNLNTDADFDFGKAELRASGRAKLDQFAAQLRTLEYGTVHVVGHADRIGSQRYNHHLSLLRAQSVKDYLVSQQIDRDRIETRGAGSSQPVTGPQDCEGLKKKALVNCLQPDRRVEADAEATKVVRN